MVLDVARELLEHRRGRAPAARTGGDLRREDAESHRLQELLGDPHLLRPVAAGLGRQRDADRVAEALLQEDAERGRGGDDPLRPHAGLGEAEVQRVVRPLGQHAIDRDQVLDRRDFRRQDDARALKPDLLRPRRRKERRANHRLARHRAGRNGRRAPGVLVHEAGQELLVERAPVGADAHRLAVADRDLDDLPELQVALVLEADVAGVDPVFVERLGAGRMVGEQLVADIVEVADQRDARRPSPRAGRGCGERRRRPRRDRPSAARVRSRRGRARRSGGRSLRRRRCRCWSSTGRRPARRRRPKPPLRPSPTRTPTLSRRGSGPKGGSVGTKSMHSILRARRAPLNSRRFRSGTPICHPNRRFPLPSFIAMQYDHFT